MKVTKSNKLPQFNFVLSLIIFLLFAYVGYKVATISEDPVSRFAGILTVALLFGVFIVSVIFAVHSLLTKGPAGFIKRLKTTYGSGSFDLDISQDLFVVSVIRKNPFILFVNLASIFLLFPITVILLMSFYVFYVDINNVVSQGFYYSLFLFIFPIYLIISFSFFNASTIALILIGEVLQTRLTKKSFSAIEVVRDYLCAFPFVIILTLFGALFILTAKVNSKEGGIGSFLNTLGAKLGMDVLRNFTTIGIGLIAIENLSFSAAIRETINVLRIEPLKLASINKNSGIIIFVAFLLACALFLQNQNLTSFVIIFIAIVLFLLTFFISEQVALLTFIIEKTHPSTDIKKVFKL